MPARALCHLFDVHPCGYFAWRNLPKSQRTKQDERLSGLIKRFWLESGGVYGYRKVHSDLRDHGETCGPNRVHRLMRQAGLKAQVGYCKPWYKSGEAHVVVPNRLQRQFEPEAPDQAWMTDITYIRTQEGWLYLAVVVDLFSRRVIGWSMQSRITKELVLDALLMAVWRRNPSNKVMVHSDQGRQYTCEDWSKFLKAHGLEASMSKREIAMTMPLLKAFFSYSNENGLSGRFTQQGTKQGAIYLITSRCFITLGESMVLMIICLLWCMSSVTKK